MSYDVPGGRLGPGWAWQSLCSTQRYVNVTPRLTTDANNHTGQVTSRFEVEFNTESELSLVRQAMPSAQENVLWAATLVMPPCKHARMRTTDVSAPFPENRTSTDTL